MHSDLVAANLDRDEASENRYVTKANTIYTFTVYCGAGVGDDCLEECCSGVKIIHFPTTSNIFLHVCICLSDCPGF